MGVLKSIPKTPKTISMVFFIISLAPVMKRSFYHLFTETPVWAAPVLLTMFIPLFAFVGVFFPCTSP